MKQKLLIIAPYQFGELTDCYYWAKYATIEGWDVTYLGYKYKQREFKERAYPGVKVKSVMHYSNRMMLGIIFYLKCILEILLHNHCNVIICRMPMCQILPKLFSKRNIILDVRTLSVSKDAMDREQQDNALKGVKQLFNKCSVISEGVGQKIGTPYELLPLGAESLSSKPKSFDKMRLFYIGTFDNRNLSVFIEGLAMYQKQKNSDVGFDIVGGGSVEETTAIKTTIEQSEVKNVRLHGYLTHDEAQKFFDECIEVMKLGTGMPAFNNDEIIIPSFIEKGVKEEDAYNYSAIGCVETAVPGKWGYRCTGMSYMNFPRILLMAMNDGVDMTSGKRFFEGSGYFKDMTSYDELFKAIEKGMRHLTRMSVIVENAIDLALERDVPDVLCSALTEDCIGRGKTIKEGGAVYDFISGLQVGIANMADSLAAIKKLVFEEKKITPEELWNAILDDYTSKESQRIQEMLINDAPKYGNDIDEVDQLVVDVYNIYIDEMKKYPNTRYGRGPIGGIRYAGTSSISANVGQGYGTMATPDGRKAHTPLAEGCSPAHAMDKKGPTAVFKSVSKLPTHEITGGVLLNQKVTPQLLSKEENKEKIEMLIKTFFNRLKGYHVQYNVVSKETLLDAQAHPEKHKDLIVRVAGYSAFFNVLSKATQDDIIGRTEQTL